MIFLLKDMKKDIQNVDNSMEVSSYVSKLNQLDKKNLFVTPYHSDLNHFDQIKNKRWIRKFEQQL